MNTCGKTENGALTFSTIDINMTDFVLTPLSCASLISEIMKTLLYQKSQIPYPYSWLESVVNKKRCNDSPQKTTNFTVARHFQTVSKTFDAMQGIMKNLNKEFTNTDIKEVVFIFGVTPVCPKEVITMKISTIARDHHDRNHLLENSKKLFKVLRNIFLSETWMNKSDNSLSCTNTYIFIKKTYRKGENVDSDIFVPAKPILLPHKVKHTVINLNYVDTQISCCDNLKVFNDCDNVTPAKQVKNNFVCRNDSEEMWMQSKLLIQGFKDCFINKVSATELW